MQNRRAARQYRYIVHFRNKGRIRNSHGIFTEGHRIKVKLSLGVRGSRHGVIRVLRGQDDGNATDRSMLRIMHNSTHRAKHGGKYISSKHQQNYNKKNKPSHNFSSSRNLGARGIRPRCGLLSCPGEGANYYAVVDTRGGGESTSRERGKWFAPATGSAEFVSVSSGNKVPSGTTNGVAISIACPSLWQQLIVQA